MNKRESIKNISKALLLAQANMGAAVKGNKNPFFKSNYADLPTVMEVVKQPLNDAGIIILQPSFYKDGKNFISTTLLHAESGEYIESDTEVICAKLNDAQNFGAGQTYARRFGLQTMLFIPSEDDDGNYASGRTTAKPAPTPAPSMVAAAKEAIAIAKEMTTSTGTTSEVVKSSTFRKGNKPTVEAVATKTTAPETQADIWS
jgi:hypothetical protein